MKGSIVSTSRRHTADILRVMDIMRTSESMRLSRADNCG